MNKKAIIQKIVDELVSELEVYIKAAHAARAEATHEQSKADNKYDTRGLEASYLARGQSKQAAELLATIEEYKKMPDRSFTSADGIDLGALVELTTKGEDSYYFVGPKAGGTEIIHNKKEVMVITPQSPLGQQLMGKKQGQRLMITIAGTKSEYSIAGVW